MFSYQPASTSEHMGAFGVFGLIQLVAFATYVRSKLSEENFQLILRSILYGVGGVFSILFVLAVFLQSNSNAFYK